MSSFLWLKKCRKAIWVSSKNFFTNFVVVLELRVYFGMRSLHMASLRVTVQCYLIDID